MRKLYNRLPGPAPIRVLILLVLAAAMFILLIPLFEWAGTFLDDGGVIGAWVDVGPGLRV
ncbi:MAG: hypothetical protein JJE47_05655 [Acidimicrobiia bacterium]|nr:hypothetical protein [Acidimicrobiia bacterium]